MKKETISKMVEHYKARVKVKQKVSEDTITDLKRLHGIDRQEFIDTMVEIFKGYGKERK